MLENQIFVDLREACKLEDKMTMYIDGIKHLKLNAKFVTDLPAMRSLAKSYDICKVRYDKIIAEYSFIK